MQLHIATRVPNVPLAHQCNLQSIDLVLASIPPILIHLADGDLHGSVVFGFDDAVRGAAFTGDVAVKPLEKKSSTGRGWFGGRLCVQIDEFAAFVLHAC